MLQVWTAEKPHPQEEVRVVFTFDVVPEPLVSSVPLKRPALSVSVPGLPLGSNPEAEKGPLAGAPHPAAVHRLRQRALRGPAAQPAPLHPAGTHARRPVPHAPGHLPRVRLHGRPGGSAGSAASRFRVSLERERNRVVVLCVRRDPSCPAAILWSGSSSRRTSSASSRLTGRRGKPGELRCRGST